MRTASRGVSEEPKLQSHGEFSTLSVALQVPFVTLLPAAMGLNFGPRETQSEIIAAKKRCALLSDLILQSRAFYRGFSDTEVLGKVDGGTRHRLQT